MPDDANDHLAGFRLYLLLCQLEQTCLWVGALGLMTREHFLDMVASIWDAANEREPTDE